MIKTNEPRVSILFKALAALVCGISFILTSGFKQAESPVACQSDKNEHTKVQENKSDSKEVKPEYTLAVKALETKKFRFLFHRILETMNPPEVYVPDQNWAGVDNSKFIYSAGSKEIMFLNPQAIFGKNFNPNVKNYKFRISKKGKVTVSYSYRFHCENNFTIELPYNTNIGVMTIRTGHTNSTPVIMEGYVLPL